MRAPPAAIVATAVTSAFLSAVCSPWWPAVETANAGTHPRRETVTISGTAYEFNVLPGGTRRRSHR